MRYIGYANMAHINEHSSSVVRELSDSNCKVVHLENPAAEEKIEWNYFIDELGEGDVAVLYSFSNSFSNYAEMLHFLKMCTAKHIRIISIHDEVDTSDKRYTTKTADLLAAIMKVSCPKKKDVPDDLLWEIVTGTKKERKLRRQKMIINMYNAGYKMEEIMRKTGYKGKSNIYRILHAYNIPLEYPAMVRTGRKSAKAVNL